ncbi:hypothetical protein JCM8202_002910, partial [Rhodotorula sphaerocarpa]
MISPSQFRLLVLGRVQVRFGLPLREVLWQAEVLLVVRLLVLDQSRVRIWLRVLERMRTLEWLRMLECLRMFEWLRSLARMRLLGWMWSLEWLRMLRWLRSVEWLRLRIGLQALVLRGHAAVVLLVELLVLVLAWEELRLRLSDTHRRRHHIA